MHIRNGLSLGKSNKTRVLDFRKGRNTKFINAKVLDVLAKDQTTKSLNLKMV